MHKLEKLILETYAQIDEDTLKPKDLPTAFKAAIEKRHGPLHKHDFFNDDLTRYMKFDGENKVTGEISHKVIQIPSFDKMYGDYSDIVQDIKVLMRDKDVRTDKAARELFELIKTNFRKLQRYLRIERPDQYAIIRNRATLESLFEDFQIHVSLITEMDINDPVLMKMRANKMKKNKTTSISPRSSVLISKLKAKRAQVMRDMEQEAEPEGGPIADKYGEMLNKIDAAISRASNKRLNESMLDEVEDEEPTPEEEPDTTAGEETVLEDATDKILGRFPTVKAAIIKLQTEQFKEFVESIDWISPRPSSFRVNLKNGQDYILKWTGKTFEAQILGKKYILSKIDEYQQALDKLSILYKEAPMAGAGDGEAADVDTGGGGGGGGGEFPGEEGGAEGGDDFEADDAGGEEGGADLGGEEIDFEEPAEEPEA